MKACHETRFTLVGSDPYLYLHIDTAAPRKRENARLHFLRRAPAISTLFESQLTCANRDRLDEFILDREHIVGN
ncbi:MAG: hypothetical protein ACI841_000296 [Planctomycetota bacterium]|jgi:hypothetical protein